MNMSRVLTVVFFFALMPLTLAWAHGEPTHLPADAMVRAAQNFLNALSPEQQATATRPFDEKRSDCGILCPPTGVSPTRVRASVLRT